MMTQSLLDNPILIKHVRSRLRPQQIWPFIAVVLILCACITWIAFGPRDASVDYSEEQIKWQMEQAFYLGYILLLILQGLILFLLGSSQVAGSISQARESGMMDFHRISPLRPTTLVAGFLLGAPVREYLLFACTLPFLALFMVQGTQYLPFGGMAVVLVVMLAAAVFYHLLSFIIALVAPKPRGSNALAILIVIIMHALWILPPVGYLSVVPTAYNLMDPESFAELSSFTFYGNQIHVAVTTLLHLAALILFFLVAAVRKMRHERAFAYRKPMAVAFFGVLALLIVGDLLPSIRMYENGNIDNYVSSSNIELAGFSIIYSLVFLGIIFCVSVTPGAGDFLKGIRHAEKFGLRWLSIWHDYAANWGPLVLISVMIFAASCVFVLSNYWVTEDISRYMLSGLVGACAVFFFGTAKQAFDLLFRKNSMSFFALLLFVTWVVPLLIGIVIMISTGGNNGVEAPATIMSFSPIFGIATSGMKANSDIPYAATVIPIVTNAVLALAFLVISAVVLKRTAKAAQMPVEAAKIPVG